MKKGINIDFKKLSSDPRLLVVIIAIACAALIALCVYTANQTKATEKQISDQVAVFKDNKTAIENLLSLKARSEQYVKQNEEYESLITSDGLNQQDFMVFFDNFCKAYDCRMTLIEFGEQGVVGEVQSLSFTLTVEGEFENLMAICDGIVTQDRFYRIDGVTFAPGTGDNKVATISVVAFSK
ncbi:MAG: hypothetical protein E7515_04775 [Ruminococcaceae bacterium]|jgi:hypothetical protein|nr:hypothetical protein [Oscillospiraceae bacterium]